VRRAVVPHESAGTVELCRERARVHPEHLHLLAELDGRLAGSGIAGLSDSVGRGFVAPRVLPDVRRRGLALALKSRELAWAAENGYREVITSTQQHDAAMRAVNDALGYEYRGVSVTMVAPLPLRAG
jgi:GNAT superfamily N-acetyltransferase